ncbi:UNVERIFIED_CONTAM: hypothetical protein GTU68_008956 [Idotea baltica]|nr:hypothetical protein [Idotea baltica]
MGSDNDVVHAARISTDPELTEAIKAFEPGEVWGLINFLMKNRHGTPFEHNSFRFYVKAPIFVFREYHRHRIGWSYNEMSGRYTELLPEFYVPGRGRNMVRKEGTKTGAYSYEPDEELREWFSANLIANSRMTWEMYQEALYRGVVNEVARMLLPVNIMSQMWATANARSIMAFLSLRTERPKGYVVPMPDDDNLLGFFEMVVDKDGNGPLDAGTWAMNPSKPQREIAMVAECVEEAFAQAMPLTYEAWNLHGRTAP